MCAAVRSQIKGPDWTLFGLPTPCGVCSVLEMTVKSETYDEQVVAALKKIRSEMG